MSQAKELIGLGVDGALLVVSARIAALTETQELLLQMKVAHDAGTVLSDEQVQAQFDQTDAVIQALRAEVMVKIAAK